MKKEETELGRATVPISSFHLPYVKEKDEREAGTKTRRGLRLLHSSFFIHHSSFFRSGFTLIEIMVVVAIIGLIMAMGVPSILAQVKKDGMRKAISDIQDVCAQARGQAIMQSRIVSVVFHPLPGEQSFSTDGSGAGADAGRVSSSALPDGVQFAMLDINQMDFGGSDVCWVRFFPDGTCDEMTIVLHAKDQYRKLTLEFSTGIVMVSDVDQ